MTCGRRGIRRFHPGQKSINDREAAEWKRRAQIDERQITRQYRIRDKAKPACVSNGRKSENRESKKQRHFCEIRLDARKNKSQQSDEKRNEKEQNTDQVIYSRRLPFDHELL